MLGLAFGVSLMLHASGSLAEEVVPDSFCHSIANRLRRSPVTPDHAAQLMRDAGPCSPDLRTIIAQRAGSRRADARTDAIPILPRRPPARSDRPVTSQRPGNRTRYAGMSPTRVVPRVVARERLVPPDPRPIDTSLPATITYRGQTFQREFPSLSRCESPEGGWIGLVEMAGPDPRITFDGGPPQDRTTPPGAVPDLMHVLTFSAEHPAYVFTEPTPCYVAGAGICEAGRRSGRFVVTGRVRYNAGPHGTARWQLCIRREGEVLP